MHFPFFMATAICEGKCTWTSGFHSPSCNSGSTCTCRMATQNASLSIPPHRQLCCHLTLLQVAGDMVAHALQGHGVATKQATFCGLCRPHTGMVDLEVGLHRTHWAIWELGLRGWHQLSGCWGSSQTRSCRPWVESACTRPRGRPVADRPGTPAVLPLGPAAWQP